MTMVGCLLLAAATMLGEGWEFSRDEKSWETVNVPHDWAIAGPFDKQHDIQVVAIKEDGETKATEKTGRTGALPWIGKGTYRREVVLPEGTRKAALVFGGAMSEPQVFWDGAKVGEWKWGYTSFKVDLPDVAAGAHTLEVRLENRPESSRWYPGAGLYRPVYLVLDEDDAESAVFARPEKRASLPKIEVNENGFFLNGERVKFKGVCLHHDLGSIGAEWNASAFRRQVRLLKEIGVNAIRTAHNQPNAELLDICDEEGIYVMAESFDAWRRSKVKNGYNLWYKDWWKRDLEQLVKVCRDHPCVVMYSLGNEIAESVCPEGPRMLNEMQGYLHALDPSRPCTLGNNRPLRSAQNGVNSLQDIAGANYHIWEYEPTRAFAKHGVLLGTETSSAISTRGFYRFPDHVRRYRDSPDRDGQVSSYDTDYIDWSNLADDDFAAQDDYDWVMGQFVWTGFDYLGEPSPYNLHWPSRSSYFGIYDLAGLPKDRAWLYRSVWRDDVRTIHVLPHWTWPGREGKVTPVYVYTDAPEAELFVNGVSQGRRKKERGAKFDADGKRLWIQGSYLDRYRLRWRDVVYEPGELKAIAFYPDGTTREEIVRTAGTPAALRLSVDRPKIGLREFDGTRELAYVTVEVVDEKGAVCPDAAIPLSFSIAGDAVKFKGVCNGDATSLEVFTEPRMTTFHGALVVTLAAEKAGVATLAATAPGLPVANVKIAVETAESPEPPSREEISLDGEWAFEIDSGRRAGEKTTIAVPSCWETQGFGTWQYGYMIEFGDRWHGHEAPVVEHGLYSRKFTVPEDWRGKTVKLRFEGVMTEANVKVNGRAFPPHHSAWFPFEYDITDVVNYGGENTIDVDCGKESSDPSVNRSERRCDFWNYGGIFRSVTLKCLPKRHIASVRIDARADGTFHAVVRDSDGGEETIDEKWENIEPWDVDHPKLYTRTFELKDGNGKVVDSVAKRFGFRTVEVRPRDGVYVNGKKIVVKGVNRQTFNAFTGRTLTREMNYEDAQLIKSLNMNAVRIAHLTADEAFLEACDELGLYVEDEFCSWQKPIATELGREYLKVFLERDHNHPSIIFWSNGNEGGWNTELDEMFKEIDLQKRAVLHPWAYHDHIDTKHYPDYDRLVKKLKTGELFMPTEFQHGLYDGGLGAGLEDFWTTMMSYTNCVGGFLWALKDEAQWRDDLGKFDCCGNLAPDGLVGPNGEESGSCATVREIFGANLPVSPEAVIKPCEHGVARPPRPCCKGEGALATSCTATTSHVLPDKLPLRDSAPLREMPPPRLIAWRLKGETKGSRYEPVEASFDWTVATNDDKSVTYSWTITCTNYVDVLGVDFQCASNFQHSTSNFQLASKRWYGRGPDRIWRNRLRGPKWGVWEDAYNDAVPSLSWERPFKGWFEAKWMAFRLSNGDSFTLTPHPPSPFPSTLYIGVGSPKDGPDNYLYSMPYELGVGVYHVIPAIGNKLFKAERGGPQGKPILLPGGKIEGRVTVACRVPDRVADDCRPKAWWFFGETETTREGITADAEAFKRAGFGGVVYYDQYHGENPTADKLWSDGWWDGIEFAAAEAARLGLLFETAVGNGYVAGGPWIDPAHGMKRLECIDRDTAGGKVVLSLSVKKNRGWQKTVAVLAIPLDDSCANFTDMEYAGHEKGLASTMQHPGGMYGYREKSFKAVTNSLPKIPHWQAKTAAVVDFVPRESTPVCVDLRRIVDITDKFDEKEQRVRCELPEGHWKLLRFVAVPTGARTKHGRPDAMGLECDKMSAEAAKLHWNSYTKKIIDRLRAKKLPLKGIIMDSHEAGAQNWTDDMLDEFKRRRGYDFRPYLPLMAGYCVAANAEEILADFRKTCVELIAERYYGTFDALCRSEGLSFTAQTGGGMFMIADSVFSKKYVTIPEGEFWAYQKFGAYDIKDCSSAAHLYGKPIASAEALTDAPYRMPLAELRRRTDLAFAFGVNSMTVCAVPHMPRKDAGVKAKTGPREYGINRTNPWWDESHPFWDYIAFASWMLRQGVSAPEALWFAGDRVPNKIIAAEVPSALDGLDWDFATGDAASRLVKTADAWTTPEGVRYPYVVDVDGKTLAGAPPAERIALPHTARRLPSGETLLFIVNDTERAVTFDFAYSVAIDPWTRRQQKTGEVVVAPGESVFMIK